MKKIIIQTAVLISVLISITSYPAFAEAQKSCENNKNCGQNQICHAKKCRSILDVLTERPGEDSDSIGPTYPETEVIGNLPEVTLESGVTTVIKTILAWSMLLTIMAIVASSIYYITARGKEENITKAKDIILYLIIGMAIMAAAYGIVTGISQFDFFA